MAPTEPLGIIGLETRHLPSALALSKEAHWNQNENDWSMMFDAGNPIGIECPNGSLVASALTLPYSDQFGWISMVLVTKKWQKKGLATRLLNSCIEYLESGGRVPVLDATPAGENVYRPLGFLPHFGFQRWEHDRVETITLKHKGNGAGVGELTAFDKPALLAIDRSVFGGMRKVIIANLMARSAEFSCLSDDGGFLIGREGRVAHQIGPLSAPSSISALAMLDHALANLEGRVFIDACIHQHEFTTQLAAYGFRIQRPFLRMAKGHAKHFGNTKYMYAMAGPELG